MKFNTITILYAIAIVAVILFLTGIFKRVGIFKSKEKRIDERDAQLLATSEYFNPNLAETKTGFKPLPDTQLEKLAREVRKSVRGWGTDESQLFGVFSQLYNKLNISQLSKMYYLKYKRDMKKEILEDLGKDEKAELFRIIDSLPNA